uniref:Protein kinase domain-containing protein n=1 Tax=Quercus lobata TaxID=97700 RepID=A0A7N2LGY9_QUELO
MLRGMISVPIRSLEKLNTVNCCLSIILQWRKEVDVKNTPAVSLPKKNHGSVMSNMDMEFLPPRLPPFYPFKKGLCGTNGMLGSIYRGELPNGKLPVYECCRNGTLHDALHDHDIHKKHSRKTHIQVALEAVRSLEYSS